MTYLDRLKPSVEMVSPASEVFRPLWIGDIRGLEKKLGIFTYPGKDGAVVQDLGVGGVRYPLTIYFDGPDHDLIAKLFFEACKLKGLWTVTHPVHDTLQLQLITILERDEPVREGFATFETIWIEPTAFDFTITPDQLGANIQAQANQNNADMTEQADDRTTQNDSGQRAAIQQTAAAISGSTTRILRGLYENVAEINAQILNIAAGIQDTIQQPVIDILALGGQIQNLIQLPLLAVRDIEHRLELYGALITDMLGFSPTVANADNRNVVNMQELALAAALSGVALVATTGVLESRTQAIDIADDVGVLFNTVIAALDATQEIFKNEFIDFQYFSQLNTYPKMIKLMADTQAYLLAASFALPAEKIIILKEYRTPPEIVITEYGGLGPGEIYYDEFIRTNKLKGNEILVLPPLREVRTYVR